MQKLEILPENIADLLCDYLKNEKTIFVFPTDTVMNSWIDWIVMNPDKSGMDAVAFERFCAWDTFKGKYIQAKKEGYTVIPSILRKFFVSDLIARNAAKAEKERLQVIINPENEYAENAASFENWIEKNLSSLNFWKKRIDENATEYGELDAEDKDYLYIYNEYCNFLETNRLFEPAWVEPDSFEAGQNFVIFFPELLEDFCNFENIFSAAENIILCTLAKDVPAPKAYKYEDSRSELRQTMLRIIDIAESGRADWSEIALSVPDIDTYRPYIEREFALYNIPFVIKAGQPLTKNCAGRVFREIYDCHTQGFTYDSVRALLLDECLPWKNELRKTKEALIREGNRMRCICSPEEKDIWRQCFGSKTKRLELAGADAESIKYFEELEKFYNRIHKAVEDFFADDAEGSGFERIRSSWMNFKSQFLGQDSDFSEEANNILSRCIKELEAIIRMQKDYSECKLIIPSAFDFFLRIIDEKSYTPQTKQTGVNIFKYKLSAAANFKFQFVIDASQDNIDIQYKRLTFLNATKRANLGLIEDDRTRNATDSFIKLYAKNTCGADREFVHFSYAEESFAGFMICHSKLEEIKNPPDFDQLDYIKNERNYLSGKTDKLSRLTAAQKKQLELWKQTNVSLEEQPEYCINTQMQERLALRRNKENGHLRISARGDMENFFPCPRRWVLKNLVKLHEDSLDTDLMKGYDIGNLNHKILELFMKEYEGKKLPVVMEECPPELKELISQKVEEGIKAPSDFRDSILAINALESQKEKITENITQVITLLLQPLTNNGFGGCTVVGIEKEITLPASTFDWYGKIDLLLKTEASEYIIIDYKNSKEGIPKEAEKFADRNDILKHFQMPLYYKLVGGDSYQDFEDRVSKGVFCTLKDASLSVYTNKDSGSIEPVDFRETYRVLDDYAKLFKRKTDSFEFEPYSTIDHNCKLNTSPYENCIACPYKTICRTTYTLGGQKLKFNKKGDK